jgi:elongation of very long chain fatty acids protein 6
MEVHQTVRDPSGVIHRWVLDFELTFFDKEKYALIQRWMRDWWWLSLPYALFYIIIVFIGRALMAKSREKFELRQSLIIWNAMLTIFSFWGACRCVPECIHALTHHGFMYSVCDSTFKQGISGLW